jgi:hypothetical protein
VLLAEIFVHRAAFLNERYYGLNLPNPTTMHMLQMTLDNSE